MSTLIYHFTHQQHLDAIIKDGLKCKAKILPESYIDISSRSVQDRRATTIVPINPPNGNLQDYVPFYFGPRSPTLYTINRNPGDHGNVFQKELVYLLANAESIANSNIAFVFTDGHGVVNFTEFFDDLKNLNQIDWNVIWGKYWHDHPEFDPDRKRKRQAEFLVHQSCPWEQITTIGVFDDEMQNTITNKIRGLSHQPHVTVKRNWYY